MRIPSFCQSNDVENEIYRYSLFSCRLKLFNEMTEKCSIIEELDINAVAFFLFKGIDPTVWQSFTAFIFQAMFLA